MRILVKKMSNYGILKLEVVLGILIIAASFIGFPISMFSMLDAEVMANPYVLGFMAIVILSFASVGFFCFIRPYIVYRKTPAVQLETDGEFLYIRTKKRAKIPLSKIPRANVRFELPYIYQKEFLREFVMHKLSEEYGTVVLTIPGYGTYKMRFVSRAKATANNLMSFIDNSMNNA